MDDRDEGGGGEVKEEDGGVQTGAGDELSTPEMTEMTSDVDDVRFKYMKLDEIILRCSTVTFLFPESRGRLGGQESRDVIGGGAVH